MDQFSTVNDTDALAAWVAKQALRSANAMERAISATALVRRRDAFGQVVVPTAGRSEEHTSELQSLMRISYAVFCLKKKTNKNKNETSTMRQRINVAQHQ